MHCIKTETASGFYSVKIDIIDWKKEVENVMPDGSPSNNALSDFVIHVNACNANSIGSNTLNTFK
jgi:hypothetical protein